jgi:hypothetical protein
MRLSFDFDKKSCAGCLPRDRGLLYAAKCLVAALILASSPLNAEN